jgi:hypothetical protein
MRFESSKIIKEEARPSQSSLTTLLTQGTRRSSTRLTLVLLGTALAEDSIYFSETLRLQQTPGKRGQLIFGDVIIEV